MKFVGKVRSIRNYYDSKNEVTIETESPHLLQLEKHDGEVLVTIVDYIEDKTNQQNRYIWKLIDKIDKKINGYRADPIGIYRSILQAANVKSEIYEAIPEAEKTLKRAFRVVELIDEGEEKNTYRCYLGLSKLNKKEVSDFIEALIDRCVNEEIEYDYDFERLESRKTEKEE